MKKECDADPFSSNTDTLRLVGIDPSAVTARYEAGLGMAANESRRWRDGALEGKATQRRAA